MFYGYCEVTTDGSSQCVLGLDYFNAKKSVFECCADVAGTTLTTKTNCPSYF